MQLANGYRLGGNPREITSIEVSDEERSRGVYALGLPGSGKTSGVFKAQILQDVETDQGFGLLDIENTLVDHCLSALAAHGTPADRIIVIDPTRADAVVPLNFLAVPPGVHPQSVLEGVVSSMRRCWWDAWGPRTDDILRNTLSLAMDFGLTLADLPRLLSDKPFRDTLVGKSTNQRVKMYFESHLAGIRQGEVRTWFEAVRNKADQFVNPFLEPFLAAESCVDLRAVMDRSDYLLVRIPEAELKDAGRLFGMLIVNALYQAGLSRPEGSGLWPIYCDEYQGLANQTWELIATRLRKRGIGLGVAHQSTSQSPFDRDPSIVDTLMNVCCVTMFFQLGRKDAERFARDIFPVTGSEPKRVKKKHPFWGGSDVQSFYSINEEVTQYASELEHQKQRECFIKIRRREGIDVYVAEAFALPSLSTTQEGIDRLASESLVIHGQPISAILEAQNARIERVCPPKVIPVRRGRRTPLRPEDEEL